MSPSRQLFVVGVGVLFAMGQAAPGVSQSALEPSASAPESAQSLPKSGVVEPTVAAPDAATQTPGQEADSMSLPEIKPEPPTPPEFAQPAERQPPIAKPQPKPRSPATKRGRSGAASTPKPARPINLSEFKARKTQTSQTAPAPAPGSDAPPMPVPGSGATQPIPGGSGTIDEINQSKPLGPPKPGLAPNYLNPDANPLYFPTKPEEVQLRGIQPITLQQALELAKRNNRDLQVSILQRDRSRSVLREQQAALYPSISAQSNLTQAQSAGGQLQEEGANQAQQALPRSARQGNRGDRESLTLNGTVGFSYNIYTSGLRPAQIRAAERQLRSDQLQVEVVELQLRLDVTTDYYDLQEADEAVRIQQSAVRNAEASLRDTQALERAGLGTRFDVLRAQVQLSRTRQDLTNALATQQIRRRELAQRLAVPSFADLAAADPVAISGSWQLTLPQSVVLAFKNRAELEQLLAQRELSEQRRRIALAALGPTVNLQVQYNVLNILRDTLGFGDGYSVAAGLNWNFFDGGAARARANQQEANKAIAETQFAQTRENIQLQVETAFTTLQSSFLNIGTNRQAVVQAREALRLARLRFQAGVGTQTEVINAENDLILAESNLVTAIIGYNRALASLERAVTNLPIATGSTTPLIPGPAPTLPPL